MKLLFSFFVSCLLSATYPLSSVHAQALNLDRLMDNANNGDAEAQYLVAMYHQLGTFLPQNYPLSCEWMKKSADQDYANAIYGMGLCHEAGWGMPANREEAFKHYEKAAKLGHPLGQLTHGLELVQLEKPAEGRIWIGKAAEQGYAEAQTRYGLMLVTGEGGRQNEQEGLSWIRKAADQNNAFAINALKRFKQQGIE